MSTARLDRVTAELQTQGLAALALMPAANMRYLAGLSTHGGNRLTLLLVPAEGEPHFVLPALEAGQVQNNAQTSIHYHPWSDADGPTVALQAALDAAIPKHLRDRPIGVEYTAMRVMELRAIEAALPGVATTDAMPLLAALRMVKDSDELALMEEAVRIVEEALQRTIDQIRVGMTERELSATCRDAILAAGGAGESFGNIVASGPNSANPHHHNGDRAFAPGDLIIIDCGAQYRGYLSDITRTVALGKPSAEARTIYELVQQANAAGRQALRPKATGEEIDAATRAVIDAGGYGDYFIHRTGHGLGMEAHELPNIVAGSSESLAPGTTFTIEPGIYLPGQCGVRIEDDVVLTAEGGRSLTSFPRDLMVLPV